MAQEIADSKLLDTWGSGGTKIEPDISKIIEGWQLGEQPPHEYMNWLQNTFGSKLNHILKNGVASWNNETEYLAGSSVQHSGNVWICETTNTNSEPTDLNANWEKIAINKDLTITVDTLSDLRSISYPANIVWASGYHAKNDGAFGSHIFRLKGVKTTETDNGGTVIIATIGGTDYVYELQFDGAVNVKWFGAKGDWNGTTGTDDTVAIQNAINSQTIQTSSDGKLTDNNRIVYIPSGIYSVTNIYLKNNITLKGEGSSNTVLKANGNSGFTISSTRFTGGTRSIGTNIEDLSINGSSNSQFISGYLGTLPTVGGIDISSSIGCNIKNVKVIYVDGTALSLFTTQDSQIMNVDLLHSTLGIDIGKYDNDISNAIHFMNIRVENCTTLMNIDGGTNQVRDINFIGSKFEGTILNIKACNGIEFSACSFMSQVIDDYMIKIIDGVADTRNICFTSSLFTSSVNKTTKAISSLTTANSVVISNCTIATLASPAFYGNIMAENNSFYDCKVPVITVNNKGRAISNSVYAATYNTLSANESGGFYGHIKLDKTYSKPSIVNVTLGTVVNHTGLIGNNIFKNHNDFPLLVTGFFKVLYDASNANTGVTVRLGNSSSLTDQTIAYIRANANTNLCTFPYTVLVPAGGYFQFFSTSEGVVVLSGGVISANI